MVDYLYDGSFEGFLTCIYEHYYNEKASGIYRSDFYQASILVPCRTVETEENKATRVYDAIENKISREDLKRAYRVFLSSAEEKENKLLQYLRLGFQKGSAVSLLHSNPIVFEVQQIEKKVTVEMHRLKGLVRFSALVKQAPGLVDREILYCKVEPDHDVLEIIADHFADRLKSDPFIIHDKIRNKAVIAQAGSWYIAGFTDADLPGLGELERDYRDLWKRYFETIAIQERINPACQKRMMPVRYWKNLTEFR
ncbi:TIGR03915 family putative DNA repair protein [Anoxybacterium hadale]|uniref:TIGR03915 family putative DNA repair protein n=1 Tax=Anoxybacterium hadale TaxID=3408580 RepID=UPI003AFFD944